MRGRCNYRKTRIGVSIPLFLLFFVLFLGEKDFTRILSQTLLLSQFVPSLLRFFSDPGHILSLGLVVILLITFIGGRIYCSFLCPLGMLQDLISWISGKVRVKKRYGYRKSYQRIHLTILFCTFMMAALGYLTLLNLLDPYGLFGRISAHLFKFVLVVANNMAVSVLEIFDIFNLSIKRQHHVSTSILLLTAGSFGCLLVFSLRAGRLYCNSICPVGAVLGLVSRFSLYKIRIDKSSCTSCNLCEKMCKAGCIKSNEGDVDNTRCLACFDCLAICRSSSIGYKFRLFECYAGASPSLQRRKFLGSMATFFYTLTADPLALASTQESDLSNRGPITPPGSFGLQHFTSRCSGCHLCVSSCPTHALVPTLWKYGLSGLLQPEMDYRRGHCEISCITCSSVCPTGAIMPVTQNEKKLIQIGVVALNKELCVVHVKKKHCGACGEACPTNAIFPVEKGRVLFPDINNSYCIGCGGCEQACPTFPKSIKVTANSVHLKAEVYVPPELPVLDMEVKSDFPF